MRVLLAVVTGLFSAFTVWVVWQTGYLGYFEQLLASPAGWQILADITIALFLVLSWIRRDARTHARRFWPWALLTVALGSIGPLLYLLLRPRPSPRAEQAEAHHPVPYGSSSQRSDPVKIASADWKVIRRVFTEGFAASSHFAVASVGEDGSPHVTPIGSLVLGAVGEGFFFEEYAVGLARRLQRDQRVCVMAVDSGWWELLRTLWRGKARRPLGVRLHGTVGERRDATPAEIARFQRRVRHLRFLRGHRLLWGGLRTVREVRFHGFDPVRIAPLGDPWPGPASG